MLEFEGVSIRYGLSDGFLPAVEGVSALLPAGAIGAIVGPTGCGKTSLVRAAAGLLPVASGRVLVEGKRLEGVRAGTTVIFQDFGLLPWKTVEDNAELPLLLRRVPRRERKRRVAPILEELGLSDFGSYYPARLSGGMRQRVAIARALAAEPDLLLMDEPFSSLDAITREGMQESLLAVARRRGMSVLIVTHSIEEAAFLADETWVMRGRAPGRVVARIGRGEAGPGPRGNGFRGSAEYFRLCVELRRLLEASLLEGSAQ